MIGLYHASDIKPHSDQDDMWANALSVAKRMQSVVFEISLVCLADDGRQALKGAAALWWVQRGDAERADALFRRAIEVCHDANP